MTDNPIPWVPLDADEQPVYDNLVKVRAKLNLLNQDRTTYFRSCDVHECYKEVIQQAGVLLKIRAKKPIEQNKLDHVLDDCFQLVSLAFLTLGKCSEVPAIYSAVSTIIRLLNHLNEAAFFSPKDLQSIRGKLKDYRHVIDHGRHSWCPNLLALLERRLTICYDTLAHCEKKLSSLTPEFCPTYEKLVSIARCLIQYNLKPKFPMHEVNELHAQLKDIGIALGAAVAVEGDDYTEDQYWQKIHELEQSYNDEPTGQKLVVRTLTKTMLWVKIMRRRQGKIDERFRPLYEKLLGIRNHLEKLHLTRTWSLRETDLYSYQRELDVIDASRVDGKFIDEQGQPADLYDQRTMVHMIRKSYALIYLLIISSEPVSEALLPIYNQLLTLKKCMLEVQKNGGVSSSRELYPYIMKLDSIRQMRIDGKFKIGDDFPDGQDNVNSALTECLDVINRLRLAAGATEKEVGQVIPVSETLTIQS